MKHTKKCPECGGTEIYIESADGQNRNFSDGPDLLPYLGGMLNRPQFDAFVCASCGLYQLFVGDEWKYEISQKWQRHE